PCVCDLPVHERHRDPDYLSHKKWVAALERTHGHDAKDTERERRAEEKPVDAGFTGTFERYFGHPLILTIHDTRSKIREFPRPIP
ncbi:MAG: hypothetical protein ACRDHZ_02350, partial [Ktedonobacteraceae bacterium]